MSETMKAITLFQPWAQLVARNEKRIETRSWKTPHRGPLAIHASKAWNDDLFEVCLEDEFWHALGGASMPWGERSVDLLPVMPFGCVVATCRLISCLPTRELQNDGVISLDPVTMAADFKMTEKERGFGDFSPGRWAWLLADIKPLPEPIPARGYQFIWGII